VLIRTTKYDWTLIHRLTPLQLLLTPLHGLGGTEAASALVCEVNGFMVLVALICEVNCFMVLVALKRQVPWFVK
jgi:hypothetical protein